MALRNAHLKIYGKNIGQAKPKKEIKQLIDGIEGPKAHCTPGHLGQK
jgi:hypothetical protein